MEEKKTYSDKIWEGIEKEWSKLETEWARQDEAQAKARRERWAKEEKEEKNNGIL